MRQHKVGAVASLLLLAGCASTIPQQPTTYWAYEIRAKAQDGSGSSSLFAIQWAPSQTACRAPMMDAARNFAVAKLSDFTVYDCREIVISQPATGATPNMWAWTVVGWEGYGGGALTQDICERSRKASAALTVKSPCIPIYAAWK